MERAEQEILQWAKAGEEFSTPGWEELPGIPLYMDQVIFYLKDSLGFFQREPEGSLLTSSMINNYVKNGVLPHPDKKKYGKEHLAALTVLCLLKPVLSIPDIGELLRGQDIQGVYGAFLAAHTAAVRETCQALQETCRTGADLKKAALLLAAQANAKRAAAERILCELGREEPKNPKEGKGSKG